MSYLSKVATIDSNGVINPKESALSGIAGLSEQESKMVKYIQDNQSCTTSQIVELLNVKGRWVREILSSLSESEVLEKSRCAREFHTSAYFCLFILFHPCC